MADVEDLTLYIHEDPGTAYTFLNAETLHVKFGSLEDVGSDKVQIEEVQLWLRCVVLREFKKIFIS